MTRRLFSLREYVGHVRAEPVLRRRVAVLSAVVAFFAAGLIAAGLAEVVLVVVCVAVLLGVLALAFRFVPRHDARRIVRSAWSEGTRQRVSSLVGTAAAGARRQSTHAARRTQALASTVAARVERPKVVREQRAVPRDLPSAEGEFYGWPYAGSDRVEPQPVEASVDDERRRAAELNTRGAELRRAGNPAAAAAEHLEALEIVRSLDDRVTQAQTLNSLGLALAAAGETDAAVERFEEALMILRTRADEPEQGKVIANLGVTLLRQGADDRGRELLNEALEKLPRDSPAAQRVEAQLRRAS